MTGRERVWRLDVISQGREPEREFRPPLSRRWRVVAGAVAMLAVGAVLAVTGIGHRHGTGTPAGAAATPTTNATPEPGMTAETIVPADTTGSAVCSPSTGACSIRVTIINGSIARYVHKAPPAH
jgi:hypothetical protein